jgi:hypothetical protein
MKNLQRRFELLPLVVPVTKCTWLLSEGLACMCRIQPSVKEVSTWHLLLGPSFQALLTRGRRNKHRFFVGPRLLRVSVKAVCFESLFLQLEVWIISRRTHWSKSMSAWWQASTRKRQNSAEVKTSSNQVWIHRHLLVTFKNQLGRDLPPAYNLETRPA